MRSPSRPPEPNQLLTFVALSVLSLLLWGVTAYVWYQSYLWFSWVTEPTFLLTLFVLPIPFLAYRNFTGSSGLPTSGPPHTAAPTAPAQPAQPAQPATRPQRIGLDDWLLWLGNGERQRGTMVVLIFLFWTILYWSLPTISLTALTFSAWGLLTILGVMTLRFFFRPSKEVSAPGDPKSQSK